MCKQYTEIVGNNIWDESRPHLIVCCMRLSAVGDGAFQSPQLMFGTVWHSMSRLQHHCLSSAAAAWRHNFRHCFPWSHLPKLLLCSLSSDTVVVGHINRSCYLLTHLSSLLAGKHVAIQWLNHFRSSRINTNQATQVNGRVLHLNNEALSAVRLDVCSSLVKQLSDVTPSTTL